MKAHICIGGPLDGLFATSKDLEERDGMYAHLGEEYGQYNSGGHWTKKLRNSPSMVWIHHSILKPSIFPKAR